MALLFRLMEDLDRSVYNPNYAFGFGLTPDLIHRHRHRPVNSLTDLAYPSWSQLARVSREQDKEKQVSPFGKDGFQVSMDVTEFKPSELNVKVVDNCIVVEGKHEEREDNHGYISRQFVRRYALPNDYDAEKVASTLSSDGVLTVSVPKPQAIEDKAKERVIQIQHTGPAHLNIKDSSDEEAKKEKEEENDTK